MKSCSFKKTLNRLGALVLALCLALPVTAFAAAPGVSTESALRVAIENANDGDTILVDDITFESQGVPVSIGKNLTLRSAKEHGTAIFSRAAFVLDGSEKDLDVSFDNITFYAEADALSIRDDIWSEDCEPFMPAMRFQGNVDVSLNDCVFRNYMSLEGANLYADYSSSDARIAINAKNCAFL